MTRIFIQGYELDVNHGLTNQLNFSIDELSKLDTKTTSFSKTIVLPGTARNNKLFGNIFEVGNSNFSSNSSNNVLYNFNASKSVQARIEVDNMQVMKGVLRLLEIIIDGDYIEYEVAIFGELGGFITNLGAKKLQELDFSEYNHTYSIANITSSWDASGGTGYYYPLIDYGNVSPATNTQLAKKNFFYTAFRPALFVRDYMNKIITGAGYTWQSNFFNTNFFKRLIIPNNQTILSVLKSRIFSAAPTGSAYGSVKLFFTNEILSNFTTTDHQVYTYNGASSFTGTINLNLSGFWYIYNSGWNDALGRFPSGPYTQTARFGIYVNDNFVSYGLLDNGNQAVIGGTTPRLSQTAFVTTFNSSFCYLYNISFSFSNITLAPNDTISIRQISSSGTPNSNPNYPSWTVPPYTFNSRFYGNSITIDTNYPISAPALLGDNLRINDTLPPNVLQKDFFTSILKMFNLLITEDKYKEKHLIIEPYVDFYDLQNYEDWSDMVDRSQPMRIKPMSEINARYYNLKFREDKDFFNEDYKKKWSEGYGDRVYDNMQEFCKDNDSVEVIFSNSPLVGYQGEDKVYPAIYKKNNGIEENISHNIRIMQKKKISGVASWKILSDTMTGANYNTLNTGTVYPYAGHLDDPDVPNSDICFGVPNELFFELASGALGNNLFNTYYSPYFAEITDKDSRLLKCKIKFNPSDIYNLDFTKLKLIDGVLYRLYKIIDYTEDDTCSVELLRVINTVY